MEKQEFLLLIPAIVFGVAIVDLLKLFSHKRTYFELVGWGIFLMLSIVGTWMRLFEKLDVIESSNLLFLLIIAQAMLYARTANIITPEEKHVNTKEYFFSIIKPFFLLIAVIAFFNLLMQYFVYDDHQSIWLRPLGIVLALICAFVNRVWVRTLIMAFFLLIAVLTLIMGVI